MRVMGWICRMAGRTMVLLTFLLTLASSLPAREERSQTLWFKDKDRDTRVDDVIKDIKTLVEAEYNRVVVEGGKVEEEEEEEEEEPVEADEHEGVL